MKKCIVTLAALVVAGLVQPAFGQDLSKGRWVDLSHSFSRETIYWPTATEFTHETVFEGKTDKGYYYSAYNFSAAEHGGTHVDAPIHFVEGRKTVDQLPVDQMIGPVVVIDVSEKARTNRDYQVTPADFIAWESKYGELAPGVLVLINTGSSQFWPEREKYMGTKNRGDAAVSELHFPGLGPEAATWLVKNRSVKAVGIDTPSIDYGQSTHFESHRILFAKDIPALENVANLDELPATGATLVALPMKIEGGSGAPTRIVAFVPRSGS